ncbi:hypothetical protein Hdeb2414_s0011g00371021 [Helianthus debilis subsp. tardiflorus]
MNRSFMLCMNTISCPSKLVDHKEEGTSFRKQQKAQDLGKFIYLLVIITYK